jgi:2-polyprenyl-3-methyl-5-hydroxy-6-metoxy-1,4-benzoquinol methylase
MKGMRQVKSTAASPNEIMWGEFQHANEINPAQRHRIRIVVGEVGNAPRTIADLGCGSGHLLKRLGSLMPEARRYGLDIEPTALQLARQQDPGAEFLLADLQASPPEPPEAIQGKTDVIICSEVLEHLAAPQHLVALARGLLRPGGRLIITVPSGPRTRFDETIGHLRHYTSDSLRALLEGENLRIVRLYHWGFPFHSMFRMALELLPSATERFQGERLSVFAVGLSKLLYWLFFLNIRHATLGRQLVAVATPA